MMGDRSPNQNPGLLIARSFTELPSIRSTQRSVNGGEEKAMSTAELIGAEIECLKGQRNKALAQAEDAERKLEGMNERRIALAPPAFTGDEAADRELIALEKEADQLSRKARLARNTASKLGRLVEELKLAALRRSAASTSAATWGSLKNATG
jgi:hypothetical protein